MSEVTDKLDAIEKRYKADMDASHARIADIMPRSRGIGCLLPDDDTAVERLAPIVHQVFCVEVMEETHQLVGPWDEGRAATIIERLREGLDRKVGE